MADPRLQELLACFRGGDEQAFDELAAHVGRLVYPRVIRTLGDHATADDITQELLLRVYKNADRIEDPKAFEGWIFRTTHNLIQDHFRKLGRERRLHATFGELREKLRSDRMSKREREELAEILMRALSELDEKHREVFILKEVEGLAHEEIAQLLEIPEGTVWSRLSYARKGLRDRLTRRPEGLEIPRQS